MRVQIPPSAKSTMDKSTLLKIITARRLSTIEALAFSRELKNLEIRDVMNCPHNSAEVCGGCERIFLVRCLEMRDIERGLIALKNLK